MPKWLNETYFLITNFQWLGIFLAIVAGFIVDRITRWVIGTYVANFLAKKDIPLRTRRKKYFTAPFGIIGFFIVVPNVIEFLALPESIAAVLDRAGLIILTIAAVWAAHHIVDIISYYFEKLATQSENRFDDILVPLLRKSAKVFVISIGTLFICHSLTLDVKSVLAGLGIGGLAFALAAKDTLSNLFGSLTVILDRPFHIGDWVVIGKDIEGTVEEVGFRSTRVRTFYDSLISVPNNQLTNVHIDNYGRRKYRRMSTRIGITYDTPIEKIEKFCESIKQLILNEEFTRKDYFHVRFNQLGSSSLEILLYVFWEVPDWSAELAEREKLLIKILGLGREQGVEFAFPTQTIHLATQGLPPENAAAPN